MPRGRRRACPAATGPRCLVWTGKVLSVNDGDTFKVDIDGDGRRRGVDVRFAAVQAMELTVHHPNPAKRRDECHGIEATARVEQLVKASGKRVRLTAEHASSRSDRRLARHVAVRRGGRWEDLGSILMAEGHALFLANPKEPAWNRTYDELSQQAALAGRGIWNPTHCGAGPAQDVPLTVWVNWNPPGVDNRDVNGEWVKVRNDSPSRAVPLAGWWIRDSMQRRYTLPAGTTLQPGQTLTLHTGRGTDRGLTRYWGLGLTLFPNVGPDHLGDGAYLFDPQGDLRASMTYPCLVACEHPDAGALTLRAEPGGRESATSATCPAARSVSPTSCSWSTTASRSRSASARSPRGGARAPARRRPRHGPADHARRRRRRPPRDVPRHHARLRRLGLRALLSGLSTLRRPCRASALA